MTCDVKLELSFHPFPLSLTQKLLPLPLTCRRCSMYKGREIEDDKTLAESGVTEEGAEIVSVRKVLVAEGWKIVQQDDEDSDTEEDDF